jgi:hypothetical protein
MEPVQLGPIDRARPCLRFHLKTKTESSLRNVVFLIKEEDLLRITGLLDFVHRHNLMGRRGLLQGQIYLSFSYSVCSSGNQLYADCEKR